MPDEEALPIWDRSCETGIELIDCEHKMILSALKDFLITVQNDLGDRLSAQVLLVLCNYTRSHFENEERIMLDIGYAELDEHRIQHGEFLKRLHEARARFEGRQDVRRELVGLFQDFLYRHILIDDAKIAERVRAHHWH